jgi:uncharacterized membrane protein
MNLVELLRGLAQAVATVVEGVGVAIVALAVLVAAVRFIIALAHRAEPFPPEGLRLGLGRSLALSLEFLLGADILRTAVEPSWDEIGRLAAIAAIRTALNYFLQREIAEDAHGVPHARSQADRARLRRSSRCPDSIGSLSSSARARSLTESADDTWCDIEHHQRGQ